MKYLVIAALLLLGFQGQAQQEEPDRYIPPPHLKMKKKRPGGDYELPDPKPFGAGISAADLQTLITVLASDSMQGRETGQPGQRKAADYIAQQFEAAGIPAKADRNSYFQKISLEKTAWKSIGVKVGDQVFKNREDFYVFPNYTSDVPVTNFKEIIFVGYGIEDPAYNDYGKTSVEGKVVLLYDGEPVDAKGNSLLTKSTYRSEWSMNWRKKAALAKSKGATMVFIIDPKLGENLKKNRQLTSTFGWTPTDMTAGEKAASVVNTLFISEQMASSLFGSKAEKTEEALAQLKAGAGFKPIKIKSKGEVWLDKDVQTLEGDNVIAFIEGSDSILSKEYVIVTAHYDHLGFVEDRIYYGADDNASGTAGVVEIARAFAEAKNRGVGPKRSVICMLLSGEEKGLLGSKYYVEYPLWPLKKTVANINIDMIGRIDDTHSNGNYIYAIGSDRMSTELHQVQEWNNELYTQLEIDYKYNDPKDPNRFYERSDHYNFVLQGIPAVFYFNGTHPDYHKVTDTVDKINFEAAAKRAQLAFYTAWDLANRPRGPLVDKK